MLFDSNSEVKQKADQIIRRARQTPTMTPRSFKVPKLNFEAEDYTKLIDFDALDPVLEPPLTKVMCPALTDEELHSIPSLPCHTQAVERCIKLVTEASQKVCGAKARDGYIINTLKSQKKNPKLDSKKDLV